MYNLFDLKPLLQSFRDEFFCISHFLLDFIEFHNKMDAQTSAPNRKRQHENENCQNAQRKSQRLLVKSQQPMKITDLDDDCLEKIFENLDLRSLFNVAVANEWLRPAARVVYKRKFGVKYVRIQKSHHSLPSSLKLTIAGNYILVKSLKTCLQYLRCLGSSISNLDIHYNKIIVIGTKSTVNIFTSISTIIALKIWLILHFCASQTEIQSKNSKSHLSMSVRLKLLAVV